MMKAIKEYVFDKTISSIDEYLLSKKNKHAKTTDEAEYNKFIMKLYNKFGYHHS